MYYLISNKIVYDNGKTLDIKEYRGKSFLSFDRREYYEILKESENLYDLIEIGDLVKTGIGKIFDVRKPYIDKGLAIVPFNIIFLNEINIIAIYKQNSRGDYIKVWER